MAKELRYQMRDGRMYYIIGSHPLDEAHIIQVQHIEQRDSLTNADGFVLVKDPQGGNVKDPTVHRGWAMYIRSVNITTGEYEWTKVAAEESVDGIWSIDGELLKQFATWASFNSFRSVQQKKNAIYDGYGKQIEDIAKAQHSHDNKAILDEIKVLGEGDAAQLTYKGKLVSGSFIYDGIKDDHLVWKNPTEQSSQPTDVANSYEIAEKFCRTKLAFDGQLLMVKEVDGGVSCYSLSRRGKGTQLTPEYRWTSGGARASHVFAVIETDQLPELKDANEYAVYHLLPPAYCGNVVNHYYKSHTRADGSLEWIDLNERFSDDLTLKGAKITMCYRSTWNTASICWEDPDEEQGTSRKTIFAKTTVVRKYGSAPENIHDGTVVMVSKQHDQFKDTPFIDVFPNTSEQVFYAVFTGAKSGTAYADSDVCTAECKFPDWDYIKTALQSGAITKMFKPGDTIVSPMNENEGFKRSFDLRVIRVEEHAFWVRTDTSIGSFCYDGLEPGLKVATADSKGWPFPEGHEQRMAFATRRVNESTGQAVFNEYMDSRDGTPVDHSCYECQSKEFSGAIYNGTYDQTNYAEHGNSKWSKSNLKRWLSSREATWFTPADEYDVNGLPFVQGFLYGFKEEAFAELIREVTLPSIENGAISDLPESCCRVWMEGSDTPASTSETSEWDPSVKQIITETAESISGVIPVFKLAAE